MAQAQAKSGGGFFSKLVVVALLALAIVLYLRIVMVEHNGGGTASEAAPQASVQVVEGDEAVPVAAAQLQALPGDQMELILQVFAPELLAE